MTDLASEATQTWSVGPWTVTSIVESQSRAFPPSFLIPDATAEMAANQTWLQGVSAQPDGQIWIRTQAFVVDDGHRVVLVDPCVGNDKIRAMALWHQQKYPFLERLRSAGYPPDSIDIVVHTHLHADHLGWDTTLDRNGTWTPTFSNARHLYVEQELDYWRDPAQRVAEDVFADSIAPILDEGLGDIVSIDHDLGGGLSFSAAIGHTPGQVVLHLASPGGEALITGDFIHHPFQCMHPDLREIADWDAAVAARTRREWLARCSGEQLLSFGTHFPNQPAGYFSDHDDAWRFDALPPIMTC